MMECVIKTLCDVKVIGLKFAGTKNLAMLKVGVVQLKWDPDDFNSLNVSE